MKKIGADECDAAFGLTFFLNTLVNICLQCSFLTIFLLSNCVQKGYPD